MNFQQREQNRALATDKVLDLLRQWLPAAYDLAAVVGKWVRVTFPEGPAAPVSCRVVLTFDTLVPASRSQGWRWRLVAAAGDCHIRQGLCGLCREVEG